MGSEFMALQTRVQVQAWKTPDANAGVSKFRRLITARIATETEQTSLTFAGHRVSKPKTFVSQRVLIGFESNADWERLKKELLSLGADSVREPRAIQPDLSVATVPPAKDIDTFLLQARKLPGVRYAELDSWQFSV